ncbi:MAG: Asp-tRNA(Asn)/Glu-tRNA(Gln) amidotransferase subunit GatC [Solirubrobacterales bacterium]
MISREDVAYVARLARLRLEEEEQERMTRELSGVLDYVQHVEELDLEDVAPTSRVVDLLNVLRPDEVVPGLTREEALANAPEVSDNGFSVPAAGS